MAQTGFVLSDEGRTITILNDSGTTAIEAGDIVFSIANVDQFSDTVAAVRSSYAASDIKGKSMTDSASGYQTVLGIAQEDIPADGYGSIALEGVFMHAAQAAIVAGDMVRGSAAANNKLVAVATGTATYAAAIVNNITYKCGKALTGASADTKYIAWKLSL